MATALVLSAGGMFGAYQAGAWRALSRSFQPDLVVGASAGALNGWAIAGGCDPEELIALWLDPRTGDMMRRRFRVLSAFDPGPLLAMCEEMTTRYRPRVPYALTLVELPSLRPRMVRDADVTARHIAASCAVPFGFPPVEINGKRYVDGGLHQVVPLWAAREMGATRAIVIDALPVMPSRLIRAAVRPVRWLRPPIDAAGVEVIRIAPAGSLGRLSDAIRWSRKNAEAWIKRGADDVESVLCRISGSTA